MAQSALTVTPPSPTPPTNMACTGATPPNPPNLTRQTYTDYAPDTDFDSFPPPYFDDGAAGALTAFATNTAALASGTSAADNNTGTTPGTNGPGAGGTGFNSVSGSYPGAANGVVPASTSVAHEGAGTEVVVTAPGNIQHTYPGAITFDTTKSVSDLGNYTTTPNASHASYLTGTVGVALPTITGVSAGGASGAGTTLLTVTGTNYTRASRVYVDGVLQTTNYVSATSLTVTNAPKKATAGNRAITVDNGVGTAQTAPTNWVFS